MIHTSDTVFRSHRLPTGNGILHYREYGTADHPALLCVHGIPGSAEDWHALAELLRPHYRVVVPDLLGFGLSSKPRNGYYMQEQAAALAELCHHLQAPRLYLFGHDFGGPVLITLLHQFPSVRIQRLVLASTNLFTDTYIPPPMRIASVPVLGDLFFRFMAGSDTGLRMMYKQAVVQKETYPLRAYEKNLTVSCKKYTRMIFRRSLANLRRNYQTVQDHLAQISIPVLVLWGENDPFFSAEVARRSAAAFSNSKLHLYPHTGHFAPAEQPQKIFQDLYTFLPHE